MSFCILPDGHIRPLYWDMRRCECTAEYETIYLSTGDVEMYKKGVKMCDYCKEILYLEVPNEE